MATPAVPNRALIEAMEELGVLGWLPNRRWAVRTARASTAATSSEAATRGRDLAALGPWLGVMGATSVATSLVAVGSVMLRRSGERVAAARVLRTWGTAVACGVGLFAAWALVAIGRSRRNAR
jgi:hypothetical protein